MHSRFETALKYTGVGNDELFPDPISSVSRNRTKQFAGNNRLPTLEDVKVEHSMDASAEIRSQLHWMYQSQGH